MTDDEHLATAAPARLSDEEREVLRRVPFNDPVRVAPGDWATIEQYVERILAARAVQPTPPAQAEAVAALDEVERRLRQKPLDPEVQIVDPHLWAASVVREVRAALAPTPDGDS